MTKAHTSVNKFQLNLGQGQQILKDSKLLQKMKSSLSAEESQIILSFK